MHWASSPGRHQRSRVRGGGPIENSEQWTHASARSKEFTPKTMISRQWQWQLINWTKLHRKCHCGWSDLGFLYFQIWINWVIITYCIMNLTLTIHHSKTEERSVDSISVPKTRQSRTVYPQSWILIWSSHSQLLTIYSLDTKKNYPPTFSNQKYKHTRRDTW